MNKNSRNRRDKIEDMAFIKAITRFLSEDQYLKERKNKHKNTLKYYNNFYDWGSKGTKPKGTGQKGPAKRDRP